MKPCIQALLTAITKDPKIVTTKEQIGDHPGNDPKYLESLGLEKRHLWRLAKMGLAIKARTKNIWLPGEALPGLKKLCEVGSTYRGNGSRTKWILLQVMA
jgi:hypothetical protein